jgi:hypothetical protein
MAYTIYNNDGTILLRLPEGAVDSLTTSLTLIGKNVNDYGEYVNNNLVKLMTTFASDEAKGPISPKTGQLWYNTTTSCLSIYNGTEFSLVGPTADLAIPEFFGAMGDGTTDDTMAIQDAIDTGKSVYLADGKTYRINSGLIITTNNQRFGGPGIIKAEGNINAVTVTGGCSGVELDLTFNSPGLSGTAVRIDNANRVSVRKIYGLDIGSTVGGSVLYIQKCNQCTVDWIWATAGGANFNNTTPGTGITWYGSSTLKSDILHITYAVINCGGYGLIWDGNCHSLSCSNLGLVATTGVVIRNTADGNPVSFFGTITGTTLTVPSPITLVNGMTVTGTGISPNTVITVGGANQTSFVVNNSQNTSTTIAVNPKTFPAIGRFTDLQIDYPAGHGVEILAGLDYDFDIPYILGAGIRYASWLKSGTSYTIVYPGDTIWTAIGAANNNIGTTFTATGAAVETSKTGYAKVSNATYSGIKVNSAINSYQVRIQGGKSIGNTGYGIENAGGVVYFDGTTDLSNNALGRTTGTVWTTLERLTLNDDYYYLTMNAGNPVIALSSSTSILYNRATDQLNFTIANNGVLQLNSTYINSLKPLYITTATNSTSTTTGALQVTGGAGIGGNLYVGGSLYVNGVLTSGSGGVSSRTSVSTTTVTLVDGASATSTVTAAKGYALYSVQVSTGAWVTVYSSSVALLADSSRLITTDPSPGSGVIAEAISTLTTTTYFTPAVIGFNSDASPSSKAYLKITNNSGGTRPIDVTLTYLPIEN